MNKPFLLNAFSLQMLTLTKPGDKVTVTFEVLPELPATDTLESAIGHQDTANVLGVEAKRINVKLNAGDTAYIAQFTGGRLPEGCTTLPEGIKLLPIKAEVQG